MIIDASIVTAMNNKLPLSKHVQKNDTKTAHTPADSSSRDIGQSYRTAQSGSSASPITSKAAATAGKDRRGTSSYKRGDESSRRSDTSRQDSDLARNATSAAAINGLVSSV